MSIQLHAGQLRFHDYPKLRELHQARTRSALNSWTAHPIVAQHRPFFTAFSNATSVWKLRSLERAANNAPNQPDAQYEFVKMLSDLSPSAAADRYRMKEFVIDERLAVLYLQAMQRSDKYAHFSLDDLVTKLQKSRTTDPLIIDALNQVGEKTSTMPKPKQVAAVLRVLSNPLAPSMAAGVTGYATPGLIRGMDPSNPLHVQVLGRQFSFRNAVSTLVTKVVLLLIAVSAFGAIIDEKGLGKAMGMPGSKHVQEAEGSSVRFKDVKGVTEAKAELEEIVLYLKDPSKFTRLGGKLPRGLLLTGPPGTGKTLLAKAIAGEAGVPFFFSSGSQFEEVYVGLGAKRVRELFAAAKQKAPAIIFIDEIDAVGGTRKLKDQSALKMTLNELLVQLDGFDENSGVIVIGATNFAESLDTALLRPGRFDKHVSVPLPDVGGRKEILEMYAEKTLLSKDVDLNVIARGTTGFSGADLFNLMNQAALKASIDGLNSITMAVLEYAKDKILMGAERTTAVITAKTARCTAFHEAGHALVATLTEGAQPIHKATIMPRGSSLGMVTMLPDGDQTSQSLKEMLAFMDVAMGGRVAEELVFGADNVTSGAMSDLANATNIARNMVTKYGFCPEVGLVYHEGSTGQDSASPETRALIDAEVKKLMDSAYERAKELLRKHSKEHHLLAETLLEYETLTGDEVRNLVKHGIKPKRAVINKEGGKRGDTSILEKAGSRDTSSKQPLHGMGRR